MSMMHDSRFVQASRTYACSGVTAGDQGQDSPNAASGETVQRIRAIIRAWIIIRLSRQRIERASGLPWLAYSPPPS